MRDGVEGVEEASSEDGVVGVWDVDVLPSGA